MSGRFGSLAALWRGSAFVTVAVLALVAGADRLFYGRVLGWTAGLYAGALLCVLGLRPAARRSRLASGVLALGIGGLVLANIEEPTVLSLCVTMVAIVVFAMVRREGWTGSARVWLRRWGMLLLCGWTKIGGDTVTGVKWARRHPASGAAGPGGVVWMAGKWAVPLLLGGVFVGLFSLANPVVERWVTHATNLAKRWIEGIPDLFDPLRILFWLIVLTACWTLMRLRTRRLRAARPAGAGMPPATTPPLATGSQPVRFTIPVDRHELIERCLIVFNLVFLMESMLDMVYLAGGRRLPVGITFKQYAHRGSYPLIATALLAAAFVLIAFRSSAGKDPGWRKARLLVYAWISQNVMLTFSAGWRLFLLVNASNLTRLRLATVIWLGLVALGLLTIVWRIVRSRDNAWLLRVNIALAAAVLYACCLLNLDGFIADYNADHCMDVARNGDVLGLTYLRDLGVESIPALQRLSTTLDTPPRRAMAKEFADQLHGQLQTDLADWRGWTWRRARLAASFR